MKQGLIFKLAYLSICITFFIPVELELFGQNKANMVRSKLHSITSDIVVVAHRGASEYGPENSLAAYKKAIRMGADYIELDLQMTKDGHLIVMHDRSLKRTTNAMKIYPNRSPWLVRDFKLDEIKKLDVGTWFNKKYRKKAQEEYKKQQVPTLEEVIQFVQKKGKGKVGLFVEIKEPSVNPGVEEKLVNIMEKSGFINDNNLIFVSISEPSLRKLKNMVPGAKVVQLYNSDMLKGLDVNQEFKRIKEYAVGVGPSKDFVTPKLIESAHLNGLFVHPWTVNQQDKMAKLLSIGVDGEITNKPDLFADLLGIHKCSNDPDCT